MGIRWARLNDYLEQLVAEFIGEAKRRDRSGISRLVVDFYNTKIVGNYIFLSKSAGIRDWRPLGQEWSFKKLLLRLGESRKTRFLLGRLEDATRRILESRSRGSLHYARGEIQWDQLVFSHVNASLAGLEDALEKGASVPAMMLHLRRYIESLVRALSYYEGLKHGEHINENELPRYFNEKFYVENSSIEA